MSAQHLLRRSRRLLWLTLLPLFVLVLVLAAWQAWGQWRHLVDAATAEARAQRFAFEVIARDADHHVADLRHWMVQELLRDAAADALAYPRSAPAVAVALQPRQTTQGQADGYTLDKLSPLLHSSVAQLMWPQGDGSAPPAATLRHSQALASVAELAHQRNPDLVWSFFFGWPQAHVLLYPWVPSQLVEEQGAPSLSDAVKAWYGYEVVKAGTAEANPSRQAYWTAPYQDAGGKGLLVSHAAPVYAVDELRGIVGTDIRLSTLERLLNKLPGAPWQAWVVDDKGHVLADRQRPVAESRTPDQAGAAAAAPTTAASASSASPQPPQVALARDRLPPSISPSLLKQTAAGTQEAVATQGYRLIAWGIGSAPWTLVLVARDSDLWLATLPQVLPYSLIALGLLVVWFLGQALLRQRVLTPVLQLLGYLQRLSLEPRTPEPDLGPRWQPWVQVVTQTFSAWRHSVQRERQVDVLKSAIVDHAQSAVVVADDEGRIVEFNPAAEAMLACPREQALGQTVRELLSPARYRDSFDLAVARMRNGDPDQLMGRRLQRIACRADGSELPVEVVMWMTQADGASYFTASMTDLTSAKATAEVIERQRDALRQSEKLTAMGSLLAGVAHELNNPLAIVMGRASLLEEKAEGGPLHADAQRIRDAAERCGRIVRTFLNMARSRPAQRAPVQINDLVDAAVDMLGYTLRSHGIEVQRRLAPALPIISADGDQIGQVVLNLIVNAQQALATHEGPRLISLETGAGTTLASQATGAPGTPGAADAAGAPRVWLRICDNGPGVQPGVREKLFDPFFTTKADGMGTGLGLSVSRGIVREHGGDLVLEAGPAASFCLSLPLNATAVPEAAAHTPPAALAAIGVPGPDAAPSPTPGPPEPSPARLLVVDDEPEIADLLHRLLEEAGFEVATADCGAVALELLDTARFDAIVSDLRMPAIDGAALWRAVQARHPHLASRMLFITGDTLTPGAQQFLEETGCASLDKPFTRADVLHHVQALLAAPHDGPPELNEPQPNVPPPKEPTP